MAGRQDKKERGAPDERTVDAGHGRASDAAGGPAADRAPEGDWRDNAPAASVERSGVLERGAPADDENSSGKPGGR